MNQVEKADEQKRNSAMDDNIYFFRENIGRIIPGSRKFKACGVKAGLPFGVLMTSNDDEIRCVLSWSSRYGPVYSISRDDYDSLISRHSANSHIPSFVKLTKCSRDVECLRRYYPSTIDARVDVADKTFYHSGDLGDIIYSLPTMRALGGGVLVLGREMVASRQSCQRAMYVREGMTRNRYNWIVELLKDQPYIRGVIFVDQYPRGITYDLNWFREMWFEKEYKASKGITMLYQAYADRFGVQNIDKEVIEPWITSTPVSCEYEVLVHRSKRYQNNTFPWRYVVGRYKGHMGFIGLPDEHKAFCKEFGDVAYVKTTSAKHMASLISGAKLFAGNQSFPNALSIGIGQFTIQEGFTGTLDCAIQRAGVQVWTGLPGGTDIYFPPIPRKWVVPKLGSDRKYHLGPPDNAAGLGDLLSITPLLRHIGKKSVLHLPPIMSRMAPLFEGLCRVDICDQFPVFEYGGEENQASNRLKLFGLDPADNLPSINITAWELEWGKAQFSSDKPVLCFCPTCAKVWRSIRTFTPKMWVPSIARLSEKFHVVQFGDDSFPLVPGAYRAPRFQLRQLAAVYAAHPRYIGVDTGDQHLMLAVGGEVVVVIPPDCRWYRRSMWTYESKRAHYVPVSEMCNAYAHYLS